MMTEDDGYRLPVSPCYRCVHIMLLLMKKTILYFVLLQYNNYNHNKEIYEGKNIKQPSEHQIEVWGYSRRRHMDSLSQNHCPE